MVGLTSIREEVFFAITCVTLGTYLLPPATEQIQKHTKWNLKGWRKLAGFMGGFVFMAMVAAIFDTSEPTSTVQAPAKEIVTTPVETVPPASDPKADEPVKISEAEGSEFEGEDILAEAEPETEPESEPPVADADLIERLEREITSINDGVNFTTYHENILGIQMGVSLFGAWAIMIEEGRNSRNPDAQKLANTLEQKVSQVQSKEFPRLRQAYGKIANEKLWLEDSEAVTIGYDHATIEFRGNPFLRNADKQAFHAEVREILQLLRFDQARYRWHKHTREWSYYDINSKLDSKVMKIE